MHFSWLSFRCTFIFFFSFSLPSYSLVHGGTEMRACQYLLGGWERKNILEIQMEGERRWSLLQKKLWVCFYFVSYPLEQGKRGATD